MMKRLVFILIVLLLSADIVFPQKAVTTFLGIPVDGERSEIIQKLYMKGFRTSFNDKDILLGEWCGTDSEIHIVTHNDKVWRIMVCDARHMDEHAVKLRFNRLCRLFADNKAYLTDSIPVIPYKEDISYEMSVNHKRYEAYFRQKATQGEGGSVWFKISEWFGQYYIIAYYDNETNRYE